MKSAWGEDAAEPAGDQPPARTPPAATPPLEVKGEAFSYGFVEGFASPGADVRAAARTINLWAGEPDSPTKRAVLAALEPVVSELLPVEATLSATAREGHMAAAEHSSLSWVYSALSHIDQPPLVVVTSNPAGGCTIVTRMGTGWATTPGRAGARVADLLRSMPAESWDKER